MNVFTTRNRLSGQALAFLTAISMLLSLVPFSAQVAQAATSVSFTLLAVPNPVGTDSNLEYVTISNTSSQDVDLTGWKLVEGSDEIALSGTLSGLNDTLACANTNFAQNGGKNCAYGFPGGFDLVNTGGSVSLVAPGGEVVVVVSWGDVSDNESDVALSNSGSLNGVLGTTGGDKIDICHATESQDNPYVSNSPNINSFFGPEGHSEDTEDIIPPFYYDNGSGVEYFPGNNWDNAGQEIWNDDCSTAEEQSFSNVTLCKIGGTGVGVKNFELLLKAGEVEYKGITKHNGCITLKEIPYGNYILDEVMPENNRWVNIVNETGEQAGAIYRGSEVTVDDETERFTLQNRQCEEGTFNYGNNECVEPPALCEDETALNYGQEGDCEYPQEERVCQIGENLLKNASFETPTVTANGGQWELFPAVSDWVISSDALELWKGLFGGASDGLQNVELDGNVSTEITQTVATIPGATYELRFDFSPRPRTGLVDNSVDALVDGVLLMNAQGDGSNLQNNSWTTYTDNFVALDASTDISFKDIGTANSTGSLIDNAVLCLVREPEEPKRCEVTLVSDETDYVVEKDSNAKALSFIHGAWTAVINGATWIWGDDPVVDPANQETQTFVKKFGFAGNVTSATLYIASDNSHSASLNGNVSHDGGSTFNAAVAYDVTGEIQTGNNELAIAVTNLAASPDPQQNPAGLLYKLQIEGEVVDGSDCLVPYEEEEEERGQLIVRKVVEGGELTADDFSFTVNDGELIDFEADGENLLTLPTGVYEVVEPNVPANYEVSYDNCSEVSVVEDNEITPVCTITNTYHEPLSCESGVELITNGGFEEPVVDNDAGWDIFASGISWLVDWISPDGNATDPASLELHGGVNGWLPSEGAQYAELDGDYGGPDDSNTGEPASTEISQTIDTIPGETYTLKWDFSPRPGTVESENDLLVKVNGLEVENNEGVGSNQTNWTSHSYSFTATDDETEIAFADDGLANSVGTFVDNVSLMCEPETPYGPYCGDGVKNQEWEQCDFGYTDDQVGEGEYGSCNSKCQYDNQCSIEQLVRINLDNTDSASFDGKLYLGNKNNPIPQGVWFKWNEAGDDTANHIADEVDGLAVERDQTDGLQLAFRGGNDRNDLDIVSGSIELMNLQASLVDRFIMATDYELEDEGEGFVDIFDEVDNYNVNFDMRADSGNDGVTMALLVDEEAIAQCNPDDNDYTLTITITGDGSGIVESTDTNISCDSSGSSTQCVQVYNAGTVVDLTATADEGSNFDNSWTTGAGTCTGNTSPCQVTMNSDIDLVAHFDLNDNTITTSGGGGGRKIELGGGGSGNTGDGDNDSGPIPQVAGEQVSVVPFGAPNAGAGGSASHSPWSIPTTWLGMVAIASHKRYVR